jgi:UDP-N-acetylglucosamine--N-acetylmuramyl-(pentapeptide) pyrophosphoryl-undecaprenol N-acetylglucosamine transferase
MDTSYQRLMPSRGVLVACGGTGGHFYPGIAVGEELMARGHRVVFVISTKEIDGIAASAYPDYRFERIPAVPMPKPWSAAMPRFVATFLRAVAMSRKWIREVDAGAVLGMGGFTSTAPLVAARWSGRAAFVHESNAIPGRANLLNARFADGVLVGWEACRRHFPAGKTRVVGTPVRPSVRAHEPKGPAREAFGLAADRFTVLVMGGSQGAKGINEVVMGMLEHFDPEQIQFLHLTGPGQEAAVREAYAAAGVRSHVAEFCQDMGRAYAAGDLAICRSGASSLNEMAVARLPGILIPYPHAADDHQTRNAEVFTEAGGCLLCPQEGLEALSLARTVAELGTDPARLAAMREAMGSLAPDRSASEIADWIEQSWEGKESRKP